VWPCSQPRTVMAAFGSEGGMWAVERGESYQIPYGQQ
jgi:hypothetical protein